jgi:hypothetical protein
MQKSVLVDALVSPLGFHVLREGFNPYGGDEVK